jgi:hypothetical protein
LAIGAFSAAIFTDFGALERGDTTEGNSLAVETASILGGGAIEAENGTFSYFFTAKMPILKAITLQRSFDCKIFFILINDFGKKSLSNNVN